MCQKVYFTKMMPTQSVAELRNRAFSTNFSPLKGDENGI